MLRPVVLLWLAAPSSLPAHRADISTWAAAHGLGPIADPAVTARAPYDEDAVSKIEALLEEARAASTATAGVFEQLEQLLSLHPELPQAAWLSAERHALRARAAARGGEPGSRVQELELRATRLEGQRAQAFQAAVAAPATDSREPAVALEVAGLRPNDRVFVDGTPASAHGAPEPGQHHVQVFRGDARLWAGWIDLGSPARLHVQDPTIACSDLDLAGVEAGLERPTPDAGVLCEAWAVARPSPFGGTDVALCRASHCSLWERRPAPNARRRGSAVDSGPLTTTPQAPERLPAWLTWSAVGVGALTTVGLVLWRAGAFERSEPGTEFVFTGPTAAGFRF